MLFNLEDENASIPDNNWHSITNYSGWEMFRNTWVHSLYIRLMIKLTMPMKGQDIIFKDNYLSLR
jgi:hypothetical protein